MNKLIILGVIGGMVLLVMQFPYLMLNPGELVQGHQDIKNDCFSCHAPFGGISNEKCIACHKLSDIGKDSTGLGKEKILFHQSLANQDCSACHSDHKGINAGMSVSSFKHTLLSETVMNNCTSCHSKPADKLHGQLSASCVNCHTTNEWKLSGPFNHTMIQGNAKNNCISCHAAPKDAFHADLKGNCDQCHTTSKWVPSTFDHSAYFLLDRNHNAKCNVCHLNSNFSVYTCYGCHEHSVGNVMQEHREEGISNINDCVSCHKSGNENDMEGNEHEGRGKSREKGEDDD